MPTQQTWDKHWMNVAILTSKLSKDPTTQVGAVLLTPDNRQCAIGYNGFARGIEETPEMWNNRDVKLKYVIHAEENALLNTPFSPKDCSIYITHQPCPKCIIRVLQAGIIRVIYNLPYTKMGDVDIWQVHANKFKEIRQLDID